MVLSGLILKHDNIFSFLTPAAKKNYPGDSELEEIIYSHMKLNCCSFHFTSLHVMMKHLFYWGHTFQNSATISVDDN